MTSSYTADSLKLGSALYMSPEAAAAVPAAAEAYDAILRSPLSNTISSFHTCVSDWQQVPASRKHTSKYTGAGYYGMKGSVLVF